MNERTTRRWLLASLVLNVFLACGIAGGVWRWWSMEHATATVGAAQPRSLRFAADDLSNEQRRAYRTGLRDARREMATQIQAARDGRQEVLRLIAAPELDRTAVASALARVREADTAVRTRIEGSVADFAAGLSADDRQKLASGLARRSAMGGPAVPSQSPPSQTLPPKN